MHCVEDRFKYKNRNTIFRNIKNFLSKMYDDEVSHSHLNTPQILSLVLTEFIIRLIMFEEHLILVSRTNVDQKLVEVARETNSLVLRTFFISLVYSIQCQRETANNA